MKHWEWLSLNFVRSFAVSSRTPAFSPAGRAISGGTMLKGERLQSTAEVLASETFNFETLKLEYQPFVEIRVSISHQARHC